MAKFGEQEFGDTTGGGGSFGSSDIVETEPKPQLACMLFWKITWIQGKTNLFAEFNFQGNEEAYGITWEYVRFCGSLPKSKQFGWEDMIAVADKNHPLNPNKPLWELKLGKNVRCSNGKAWETAYKESRPGPFGVVGDFYSIHKGDPKKETLTHVVKGIRSLGCCDYMKQTRYKEYTSQSAKKGSGPHGRTGKWNEMDVLTTLGVLAEWADLKAKSDKCDEVDSDTGKLK